MATQSNPQYPSSFTPILQKIAIHLLDYMSNPGSGWTSMALGFVRNFNSPKMRSYPSFYRLLKNKTFDITIIDELLPPVYDDYPNIIRWFKTFQDTSGQLFIVKKTNKAFHLFVNSEKLEQFNVLCAKNVQKELDLAEQPIPNQDHFPPLMNTNGNSQTKEHDEALETSSTYSLSFEDRYSYDRDFFDFREFAKTLRPVQKKTVKKQPGLGAPRQRSRQEPPSYSPPKYVAPPQNQYHLQPSRIEIILKINKMYESGLISFHVASEVLKEL